MEERSVKRENAVAAYNVANDETKKVLVDLLGEDFCKPQDIRDRIKTFEDACRELGNYHPLVLQYKFYDEQMKGNFDKMEDLTSFLKLRIITAALNEGWRPEFTKGEHLYYACFELFTQEEIDNMSEENKEEIGHLLLWGGAAVGGSFAGLGSLHSRNAFLLWRSGCGVRLAFKTAKLANYAAKQFIEIYADFCCFKPEKA